MKRSLSTVMVFMMVASIGCVRQDENVIRLGAAGPMTGDQSKMGIDLRNGVELAVAEWNEKGGVLGKKIQLVPGDDQADPKQAVSIANKFINSEGRRRCRTLEFNCSINASPYYHTANIVS
jgi:branched-chain amino acid transport system substrate-binding protein